MFYLICPIGVLHVPEGERETLQDGHQHPQRQSLPHQTEGLLHRVQRHSKHDSREVINYLECSCHQFLSVLSCALVLPD